MNNKNKENYIVDIGNIVNDYLSDEVNSHTNFMESKMTESISKNIPKIDGVINDLEKLNSNKNFEEPKLDDSDDSFDLKIDFDKNSFMTGIRDISYLSSQVAALCSLGVSPDEALKYFASMKDLEVSLEIAKIQKEMTIECAKYGSATDI